MNTEPAKKITESTLGYNIKYGPNIAFDGSSPERNVEENYGNVIFSSRLREKQYFELCG